MTVITGAGASYDCVERKIGDLVTFRDGYRPPVVKELFQSRRDFDPILNKYPRVRAASAELRAQVNKGVPLEQLLRELQTHSHPGFLADYRQIPLYIQELLGEVSRHFVISGGTSFDTLVRLIARSTFQHVMFLTVNYDLLLDAALENFHRYPFQDIDSYVSQPGWCLIKLHGSVNWGKRMLNPPEINSRRLADIVEAMEGALQLDPEVRVLAGHQDDHRFYKDHPYHPAIAVPVEGKSGFACPDEHTRVAREFLSRCSNFLIIGFSALDDDVLEVLELVPPVHSLKVVNGPREGSARQVLARIAARSRAFAAAAEDPDSVYPGGFSEFVGSRDCEDFLFHRIQLDEDTHA